jgi:uncharacterized protein YggU (UPF0235/DUF167 family)
MILKIRTKADSSKEGIIILKKDEWLVMVNASKEDPLINTRLVSLVADKLEISTEKILFIKGVKSRRKILEIIE